MLLQHSEDLRSQNLGQEGFGYLDKLHGMQKYAWDAGDIGLYEQNPRGQGRQGEIGAHERIPVGASHPDGGGVGLHDKIRLFRLDDAVDHGVHQAPEEAHHGPALLPGGVILIVGDGQAGLRRQGDDGVVHHGQLGLGLGSWCG